MWRKPISVSYTHLDVDKRQAEGFPMGMRAMCGAKVMGTMMMGLGAAVYSSKAGGMDFQYSAEPVYNIHGRPRNYFMPDIMPVSYTHLDVYKRQRLRCACAPQYLLESTSIGPKVSVSVRVVI